MEFAGEERRTNRVASNITLKETFSPLLVFMMLMYPTLLGFVFIARLVSFALIIPTPTVPGGAPPVAGAPSSDSDAGKLHGAADLWETAGAGALVRTVFAFIAIAFVHLFLLCYLVLGPPGVSLRETHRNGQGRGNGRVWSGVASIAFWFTTTCFLLTYTSMARYGAHSLEWYFAAFISCVILTVTMPLLFCPSDAEKVAVGYPSRVIV